MYLVIEPYTIHHEGDERSRTHPGHGYPAYSETVQRIHEFDTKFELLDWIKGNSSKKGLRVFEAFPQQLTYAYGITPA